MGKASKSSSSGIEKKTPEENGAVKSNSSSDIQSWCEVPSIAHFCSLFRQAFDLLEFDIQELEESLLLMGTEDDTSQLVLRLLIKLLKGCSRTFTNNITEDNYNTYLRRLFLSKREEAEEDGLKNACEFECRALLDDNIDFADLSLRNRVKILQQLTEYRLDADDVLEKVKNLEASSLRVDPLGKDSENIVYWYFYGTRLYKEEPLNKNDDKKRKEKERKKKKKKEKKKKKHKKNRRESISSDEEISNSKWSVVCLTQKDWEDLTAKYKKSKKKSDRELYETLNDNFLPEIVKMFAEREREEKRKLMMLAPKRASNRIERKRFEQEERDRLLAEKMEEERRLEEEYDEKVRAERLKREEEEREKAREERIKQRDAMKELRAQRATEREFSTQNIAERQKEKNDAANIRAERVKEREKKLYSDIYNPFTGGEDSDEESKDESYKPSQNELRATEREEYKDSKDSNLSSKERKPSIINALLKVGTKSIKDITLEKPVRKSPGLLLETAGRSLLQRRSVPGETDSNTSNGTGQGLTFGLCSAKISFGLYGGHLEIGQSGASTLSTSPNSAVPSNVDTAHQLVKIKKDVESPQPHLKNGSSASYSHSGSIGVVNNASKPSMISLSNREHSSSTAKISVTSPLSKFGQPSGTKIVIGNSNTDTPNTQGSSQTKKAFSNWGGEFFKKNLDYRANTNKILEKMNLTNTLPQQNASNIIPNSSSYTNYSKRETPLSPTSSNGESFKTMFASPVSKKRPLDISPNQNSNIIRKNEPPAKQLKSSSGATIYNSYNM